MQNQDYVQFMREYLMLITKIIGTCFSSWDNEVKLFWY